jgi:ribosomal protein L29
LAEDSKLADLKAELENLRDEKRIAQATERELLTQVSVLRSEIAQLKTICNEKDIDRYFYFIYIHFSFK